MGPGDPPSPTIRVATGGQGLCVLPTPWGLVGCEGAALTSVLAARLLQPDHEACPSSVISDSKAVPRGYQREQPNLPVLRLPGLQVLSAWEGSGARREQRRGGRGPRVSMLGHTPVQVMIYFYFVASYTLFFLLQLDFCVYFF